MTKKLISAALLALLALPLTEAATVKVKTNKETTGMVLTPKGESKAIEPVAAAGDSLCFDVPAGRYVITGIAKDASTVNGTIEVPVEDIDTEQRFELITCTAYATNKNADGSLWTVDNGDYSLQVRVSSREGLTYPVTIGASTTKGRNTFLALMGNTYYAEFIPSGLHATEGYVSCMASGTLNWNVNVSKEIPQSDNLTVTLPANATLEIGRKTSHFVDFDIIEPVSEIITGGNKTVIYKLAFGETYNYRTWIKDGLTQGGYFIFAKDEAKRPELKFTDADYKAFPPKEYNHEYTANGGYETGNILLNINERGHLKLRQGDTFKAHAMRMWELTDNSTNNYFIEPDFHYTVIDTDGNPSSSVVKITAREGSAWADIKAIGKGTAIVLVSYDAIGLNYYNGKDKKAYMGGEFWGAIWPENTGVFVVTVDENESAASPDMKINAAYNKGLLKIAGDKVDAEHDIFYYLDSESGYSYTFKPTNAAEVTMAYPAIGKQISTYGGFGSEGVTRNEDGSYTLLLKEGRQIVRIADAAGYAAYQVLTAKKCHREITNVTRPGSSIFQPGDEVKIQYSGLNHPANKIAGIYNMSAYVTYNGIPNGTSLILGAGQYTFASVPKAQAVTVTIPDTLDAVKEPVLSMTDGVIQVNGYGDPIGAHRHISPLAGRNPNFTAIPHKTYFGALPDVSISVTPTRIFSISLTCNVDDAAIEVSYGGKAITAGSNGKYSGTYGDYSVTARKEGWIIYRHTFTIGDDAADDVTFNVEMKTSPKVWDGKTIAEPAIVDGVYQISDARELAWFAKHVNDGNTSAYAVLTDSIELGGYDWTPIGNTTKPFAGTFDGRNLKILNLYISKENAGNQALFQAVKGTADKPAVIRGVTAEGIVRASQYGAGIVAQAMDYCHIENCENYVEVSTVKTYAAGIAAKMTAKSSVRNSFNAARISATNYLGGISAAPVKGTVMENVFNIGALVGSGTYTGAVSGNTNATITNAFATEDYSKIYGYTRVTPEQMASGEVAYRLGKPFGQLIGTETHPRIGGKEVLHDETDDRYYNDGTTGIDSVPTDCQRIYYNPQGIASKHPFEGINIIRESDGTTRKAVM